MKDVKSLLNEAVELLREKDPEIQALVDKYEDKYGTPVTTSEPYAGTSTPGHHSRVYYSGGSLTYNAGEILIPSSWSRRYDERTLSVPARIDKEMARRKEFTNELQSLLNDRGYTYSYKYGTSYSTYTFRRIK